MESNQVLDCLAYPAGIVDFDIAEFLSRSTGIKGDDRHTSALHLFDQTGFHFRGHNRDALYLAVEETVDTQVCALRAVFGVSDDHFIVMLNGDGFEGLYKVRKKRISNVGDDESEDMTLARTQRARVRVGMVVEIPDCCPDFCSRSWSHSLGIIDGARHGCGRNLRFRRHLPDVHRKETYHLSRGWNTFAKTLRKSTGAG